MVDTVFKYRRGSSAQWTLRNPVLRAGEPGYEIDTRRSKVGDGVKHWTELPYVGPDDAVSRQDLSDHVNAQSPHPVYDDGPSLVLIYENAKV